MTGRRWAAVRISTALLLVGSGVLMALSAVERWGPACIPVEGPRGPCAAIEDHLYDFTWPLAPWEPVGSAAELFGVATLLLAIAFVFLPVLISRGAVPLLAWASGGVLAVSFGVQGTQILLSGLAGEVVQPSLVLDLVMFYGQIVLIPIVLFIMAINRRGETSYPSVSAFAYVLLLTALMTTDPLVRAYMNVGSYDSRPWHEAHLGTALVLAALALWPATRARPAPPEPRAPGHPAAESSALAYP